MGQLASRRRLDGGCPARCLLLVLVESQNVGFIVHVDLLGFIVFSTEFIACGPRLFNY